MEPATEPAATTSGPLDTDPGGAVASAALTDAPAEPLRLSPARPTLLTSAQPLWSDLTPPQQAVLEPFAAQWNGLPLSEKRAWADLARRFPRMKPAEQVRVQRRIAEWARLTPEQRKIARANYRLARQKAREKVIAEWESYQSMTPDQRSVLSAAGSTSNTAARHAGASTGLAKDAAQPLPRTVDPRAWIAIGNGTTISGGGLTPTVGEGPATARRGAAAVATDPPVQPR